MPLINYEINLILCWPDNCVLSYDNVNQATKFGITDIKLYALVVTLPTEDNAKLMQQLEPGFK